jgi:hypothetical protein
LKFHQQNKGCSPFQQGSNCRQEQGAHCLKMGRSYTLHPHSKIVGMLLRT